MSQESKGKNENSKIWHKTIFSVVNTTWNSIFKDVWVGTWDICLVYKTLKFWRKYWTINTYVIHVLILINGFNSYNLQYDLVCLLVIYISFWFPINAHTLTLTLKFWMSYIYFSIFMHIIEHFCFYFHLMHFLCFVLFSSDWICLHQRIVCSLIIYFCFTFFILLMLFYNNKLIFNARTFLLLCIQYVLHEHIFC